MIWYVSTAGNDTTGDGLTPGTAFALWSKAASVASAGDEIRLGAGAINEGSNRVNTPDGVSVHGAGRSATRVTSSYASDHNANVRIPSNAILSDFTLDVSTSDGTYRLPLGAGDADAVFVNARVERVDVVGDTDAVYVSRTSGTPCSAVFTDCNFAATYDTGYSISFNANATIALDFIRCRFNVVGPSATNAQTCRAFTLNAYTTARFYDCDFSVRQGGTNLNVGPTTLDTTATAELYGCRLRTSNGANPNYDLRNGAGTMLAVDCCGSGTSGALVTNGTVTERYTGSPLRPATAGRTLIVDSDSMAWADTRKVNGVGPVATVTEIGPPTGPGADEVTLTFYSDSPTNSVPLADADVWITSDSAGTLTVAGTLQTDSNGHATFMLDAGDTYYVFLQKDGVNSIRGESFVAVAD